MKKMIRDIFIGTALIKMESGFNELFLSDCKSNHITLRNILIDDNSITVEIKYSDTESIIKCAEKNCMKVLKIEHKGFPYVFFRYRRRFGIPIGILSGTVLIFILTSMLWSIEINGNELLPDESLLTVLNDSGINIGVFSDTVNCDDIEYMLSNRFQEISWISVYVVGSRLFVDIKERATDDDIIDNSEYCNIVAGKNGEVIRADIYEGEGKLLPGTPVVKGDLLVNGIITMKDGRVRFVNAKADIWALTENHITTNSAMNISADVVSEYKNRYSLSFFGIKLPIYRDNESDVSTNTYYFDAGSVIFPVGIERKFLVELNREVLKLDAAKASLIAFSDYAKAVMSLSENAEILEKNEQVVAGDQISIEAVLKCRENIAVKKIFTVDNTE